MARNTEWYYLQGKTVFPKLIKPDLEYKNWNTGKFYLTPKSYEQFQELREKKGEVDGILNEVKNDEDGDYVTIKRPMEKKFGNETKQFTPPEIVDKDGEPWKGEYIGNGSDLTIKIECYIYNKPFKKGKGRAIRLLSARVDNLVPFVKKDLQGEALTQVKGLDQQPKQEF